MVRFEYRFRRNAQNAFYGRLPRRGLEEARERRDETRKQVAAGIDPGEKCKAMRSARADRAANGFEMVQVFQDLGPRITATASSGVSSATSSHGSRPIADVIALELLTVVLN